MPNIGGIAGELVPRASPRRVQAGSAGRYAGGSVKPQSRRPRAPGMTEEQLQKQIVDYLSWALADGAMFFAIPNGGSRHRLEAINLKRTGTKAGIPDLEILHRGRAIFIELKTERGRLQESQRYMNPRIEEAGCPVAVCRSLDDVKAFLAEQSVPVRTESITTERIRRGLSAALVETSNV